MILENKKVLIIDDDPITHELVGEYLFTENCMAISAENGEAGLAQLEKHDGVSAIVLDWVMPEMNGIEVLRKIKQNDNWADIPVIMQTGKKDQQSYVEGIEAGAYYYLTKPYDFKLLMTILKKAIKDTQSQREVIQRIKEKNSNIISFLKKGEIQYKSPGEAIEISSWFADFTKSEKTSIGLSELLINAVEHGNLGIGFEKKEELLINDALDLEIEKRLNDKSNRDKYVVLEFERKNEGLKIRIEDMGDGFEYEKYLSINLDRSFDLHGRGIAMSNLIFQNGVRYVGSGNVVEINIKI